MGKYGWPLAVFSGLTSLSSPLLKPVAFNIHCEDRDVVSGAVEERAGEAFAAVDFGSLVAGKIGGNDHRCSLADPVDERKLQTTACFGNGHAADFVEYDNG